MIHRFDSFVIDIQPSTQVSLFRIKLSPVAVKIDRYGDRFGSNSIIKFLIHNFARLISQFTDNETAELFITDNYFDSTKYLIPQSIDETTHEAHEQLLSGKNVIINREDLPVAILLLWNFTNTEELLDVYTYMKRLNPEYHLTMKQKMSLPLDYYLYRNLSNYIPPRDLMSVMKT